MQKRSLLGVSSHALIAEPQWIKLHSIEASLLLFSPVDLLPQIARRWRRFVEFFGHGLIVLGRRVDTHTGAVLLRKID